MLEQVAEVGIIAAAVTGAAAGIASVELTDAAVAGMQAVHDNVQVTTAQKRCD
jgi:hypothetical protein